MGIWLKDAMKIDPFSRAALLAGGSGIDRMVVAANIQEVPEVTRWLSGGEILFTSGYAFGSVENAIDLITKLDQRGVAALVIKPGQYLDEVPQDMIDHADQLGFPLFSMPSDLPYMDCIIPLTLSITNDYQYAIRRTERIRNDLMRELIDSRGTEGICSVLYNVTGKPLWLFSKDGAILYYRSPDEEYDEDNETSSKFIENLNKGYYKNMLLNRCNIIYLNDKKKRICIPISAREEILAYLLHDCGPDDMANTDISIFENASTVIAIELLQERALIDKEMDIDAQLLSDILSVKYDDPDIIYRRLVHCGFDVMGKCFVSEIGADNFEDFLKSEMVDADEEEIQQLKYAIQQDIVNGLRRNTKILFMEDGIEMATLFSIRGDKDFAKCRKIISDILETLEKNYKGLGFSAGIGKVKSGFREAGQSWQEARLAKRAGKTINNSSSCRITAFEDLGCVRFLYESNQSLEMRKFYHEYMGALVSHDKNNNSSLVRTLEAYFSNNQNVRRTAEELYMHKNSVLYRLRQIEDIIGERLDDPETAFNLQMCLKLRDII